jgi:hypothetical protein
MSAKEEHSQQVERLIDYVLSAGHEEENYISYCKENNENPLDVHSNDHVFLDALKLREGGDAEAFMYILTECETEYLQLLEFLDALPKDELVEFLAKSYVIELVGDQIDDHPTLSLEVLAKADNESSKLLIKEII